MRCFSNTCEDLVLFNISLSLCFIFMSASFCLESPPSVSFSLSRKSSNSSLAYNINLSLPFSDMMNMIKRASVSGLPLELPSANFNFSTVTKEGMFCEKNEDCNSSFLSCIDGACRCGNGTFLNNGVCLRIQEISCRKNIDCYYNLTSMICNKEKKCTCESEHIFFHPPEKLHGSCIPHAKHGRKCTWDEQCKAKDENMICRAGVCDCDPTFIYLNNERCYKKATKMYDSCELDDQCFDINPRAVCSRNQICICQYGYYYNSLTCLHQEEAERSKAQQVYRTAMIAAACFMISVVSIFVICIVKKSFCGNNTSSIIPGWSSRSVNQMQRSTSVNEEEVAADKPPSYDEVMQTPCTPPPNYMDILKLFPITEGLQRHNSEPRLSAAIDFGANRTRANSFHTYDNSAQNQSEETSVQYKPPTPPPPKYEPPSERSRPSLHLNVPTITVSFTPEIEDSSRSTAQS